jgi:hypothetical protein
MIHSKGRGVGNSFRPAPSVAAAPRPDCANNNIAIVSEKI